MSEQTAEATVTEAPADQSDPKPTETVDFWKQKAREQEKRAKDNADAAKRLAEIEESQKSAAEKSADRIKTLEGELTTTRIAAFREAAVKFGGISQEDADLFLTGSDVETLSKQAERLAARTDKQKKNNHVPREGNTSQPQADEMRQTVRTLFGGGE